MRKKSGIFCTRKKTNCLKKSWNNQHKSGQKWKRSTKNGYNLFAFSQDIINIGDNKCFLFDVLGEVGRHETKTHFMTIEMEPRRSIEIWLPHERAEYKDTDRS